MELLNHLLNLFMLASFALGQNNETLPTGNPYRPQLAEVEDSALCSYLRENCVYLQSPTIPFLDNEEEIQMKVELVYIKFLDLDDLTQTFTAQLDVTLYWQLPRCAQWANVTSFGNPTIDLLIPSIANSSGPPTNRFRMCYYPKASLFHPLILHSNANGNTRAIYESFNDEVQVDWTGKAIIKSKNIFTSQCHFDFKLFPFDTQTCQVRIQVFDEFVNISEITSKEAKSADYAVYEYSLWELVSKSQTIDRRDRYTTAVFSSTYKRRYQYHALLIVLPTVFLIVLTLAAFLIPTDMPDRSSYSITVYLAFSVQQNSFTDLIPRTSQPVYLVYYVGTHLGISAVITIYMLLSARLGKWGRKTKNHKSIPISFLNKFLIIFGRIDLMIGLTSFVVVVATNVLFGFLFLNLI